MEKINWTHKGWLGICPIYFGKAGDTAFMCRRHWCFMPLYYLSKWTMDLLCGGRYTIVLTGEMNFD